jgi:hypothetical protein
MAARAARNSLPLLNKEMDFCLLVYNKSEKSCVEAGLIESIHLGLEKGFKIY